MGRTIVGKYVPVLLAVSLFVAAGFQHSSANMGFFALHIAHGGDLDWATALGWNIVPAGIGNLLGAATLAIPYWYVFRRPLGPDQQAPRDRGGRRSRVGPVWIESRESPSSPVGYLG